MRHQASGSAPARERRATTARAKPDRAKPDRKAAAPAPWRHVRAVVQHDAATETWFTRRVPLRWLPAGLYSIGELATRLGRHPKAVTDALRQGRIPRAEGPWLRGVAARVSDEQLAHWRAVPVEEAVARHPALPQRATGWRTVSEVAHRIGTSYQVAEFRLERLAAAGTVPMLEWETATPFRRQRRFWLPRYPAALTRPVARPPAPRVRAQPKP